MPYNTKIKICGLTSPEDINIINSYPIDFVGFIFAKSKRQININQAKKLCNKLRGDIKRVGIFVNSPLEEVVNIHRECSLDIIQLHGEESLEYTKQLTNMSLKVWKAFRVKDIESINKIKYFSHCDGILLDSFVKGQRGGSGKIFNWTVAKNISNHYFTILAGGIKEDNVMEAIKIVKPHVIDISSGVEKDGKKNSELIKNIVRRVKKYGIK